MFKRTSIALVLLATGAGIVGCTTTDDKKQSTELAAQSAATNFPDKLEAKTSDRVGVIVNADLKSIKVVNFGEAIANVDIWINGAYLYHAENIPANGYLKLDESKFYDHSGHALTESQVRVNTVQIANSDHLWTLLGPVSE